MDSTNLTLHIKADAAGLKQVTNVLKRMELAAGSASALSSSMSKLQLDMAGLQKASSITRGQMAGLAAAAEKEKKSLNTLSGEVARLSKSNKTLTKTVDGSTKKLKAQEKAAGKTSKSMKDLDAFTRGAAGGAGKLWLSYGNLIPMITGFASAMGAIKFTDMTTSFQYEMATIQALGSYTNKELDKLKDQLLSIRSIKGPSELVSGLKMLTKSGLDATEAIAGVKDVALLAELGSLSLSDSAKIATRSLRIFGLEEEKLGYVANILAYTASNANMEVSDLGAAMAYTTELSTLLGFGLEETSAAMMILHDKGIAASMAGTSLRTSMVRLAAPTGKTAEYMERLGISVTKPGGGQKDLEGIIGGISKAMQGLSETARSDAFRQLFGLRAQKAPIALVQAFEEGTLQSALEELRSKGAESLSIYEQIIGEKAKGKWKALSAKIEAITIQLAKKSNFDTWLGSQIDAANIALDGTISKLKEIDELRGVKHPNSAAVEVLGGLKKQQRIMGSTPLMGGFTGIVDTLVLANKRARELGVELAVVGKRLNYLGGLSLVDMFKPTTKKNVKLEKEIALFRRTQAGEFSADYELTFGPGDKVGSYGDYSPPTDNTGNEGGVLAPAIKSRVAAQKKITKSLKAELAIRSNLTQQFYRFQQFTEEEYTQQSRELKNEALEVERSDIITRRSFYLKSLESDYISTDNARKAEAENNIAALNTELGLINQKIENLNVVGILQDKLAEQAAKKRDLSMTAETSKLEAENLSASGGFSSEAAKLAITAENDAYTLRLLNQKEYNEKFHVAAEKAQKRLTALEVQHTNKVAAIEKKAFDQKVRYAEVSAGTLSSIVQALSAMSDEHSRDDFERNKKLAIASAVVNTAVSVTKSYAEFGWPFGIVAAAGAAAAGAAQIAAITSTSFEGGSPSVGPVGSSANPISTAPVGTVTAPTISDPTLSGAGTTHNITFEISAIDSRDVSSWISQNKGQIVTMIQDTYNERGTTGGPLG